MRRFRLIPPLAVALILAACTPDGTAPFAPADPSLSTGGHSTGGNRAEDDAAEDDVGTLTVQSDTTDRSGGHSTGGN